MKTLIDVIANVVAYSVIIPIALFIYFYGTKPSKHRFFPRRISWLWTTTAVGKILMLQMMAWFAYLAFATATLIWHNWYGHDIFRLVIYVALVSLFWALLIALRRVQKQKRVDNNPLGVSLDSDIEQTNPRKDDSNG